MRPQHISRPSAPRVSLSLPCRKRSSGLASWPIATCRSRPDVTEDAVQLLSEDDLNLKDLTPEELDAAWDLWFDLAQETNDFDPPYTHGVFVPWRWPPGAQ